MYVEIYIYIYLFFKSLFILYTFSDLFDYNLIYKHFLPLPIPFQSFGFVYYIE